MLNSIDQSKCSLDQIEQPHSDDPVEDMLPRDRSAL